MKRLFFKFFLFLVFFLISLSGLLADSEWLYPSDFRILKDLGGRGEGKVLLGFGGDISKDKEGNRKACKHIPVILLHGNASEAKGRYILYKYSDTAPPLKIDGIGSMMPVKGFLKDYGYNDSEIWAVSYLGTYGAMNYCDNSDDYDMEDPYRSNIEDVRQFIDEVIKYLNVKRVIIIGYSLGAGMARAYLKGLKKIDSGYSYYDPSLWRYWNVAALITIAGANYGFGDTITISDEFITGSDFEKDTHYFKTSNSENDILYDDTPFGAPDYVTKNKGTNEVAEIKLPPLYNKNGTFSGTSKLDYGYNNRIFYCGITSKYDMVDVLYPNTGYLQGADINKGYYYYNSEFNKNYADFFNSKCENFNYFDYYNGQRHLKIINETVFKEAILPIINHANLYYPHNNPQYNTPNRWHAGFFAATLFKIKRSNNVSCNNFFANAADNPESVLSNLAAIYKDYLVLNPSPDIEKRSQEYTDLTLWLNSFGVWMGNEARTSMYPSGHLSWAKGASWQNLFDETYNRLKVILTTPDQSKDNHDFLSMWYASESYYLREHCNFDNPDWVSSIPTDHFNIAQSKSRDQVKQTLLEKYDFALTYILEKGREEGENTYFAFLRFYAESAERLAMWGARCVIESNYDYFPPDPEPADYLHFLSQSIGWNESQIRQDLRKRIEYVADFLSH